MANEWSSAKGSVGSWFAVVDGERLPCVHKHWCEGKAQSYNDPWVRRGRAHADEFVDAIEANKTVILCEDEITENEGREPGFKRKTYIAVFEVSDVVCDDDGLRFKFAKRGKTLR